MTTPFLKWAGGKRWLVNQNHLPVPSKFGTYYEPFLGSASVFFHVLPQKAVLSDINSDLILLYNVIRNSPSKLLEVMKEHQRNHCDDYYYQVRATKCRSSIRKAAQFLYLNRTCWNGLYRVNLDGAFNVPRGTKDTVLFENENFLDASNALKYARMTCLDFERIIDKASENDFVFVDPPYTVKHNYNGFLKYNEKIFSWSDQVRLSKSIERAKDRGVYVAVTNADHDSVLELYSGFSDYKKVLRHSVLAGDSTKRTATSEALFLINFENCDIRGDASSQSDLNRIGCQSSIAQE